MYYYVRRLTYLEAVIMEVHRYSNVAPLAIAHRTTRKTSLQEYILPKVRPNLIGKKKKRID